MRSHKQEGCEKEEKVYSSGKQEEKGKGKVGGKMY